MTTWVILFLAELSRLEGQGVARVPGGYEIVDIAGEGRPQVGTVEVRAEGLYLVPPGVRLLGPLAHPRIAGPGYRVWVLGEETPDGLRARRIGVLGRMAE